MAVVATLSNGYDLEYVWKQVDRGPAKDAAGYYIQASENGGEPPGRWWGPGAKALGFEHGQLVERGPYDSLFGQRKAPDGTSLGRPPGGGRKAADLYARLLVGEPHATAERRRELRIAATRQARLSPLFFDLTISLFKSISIFHASLGENARLARQAGDNEGDRYWSALVGEVDDMIWQAVFSTRRESITADLRTRAARFEAQYGRAPSQRELAQLAQASNFKTRKAKHGTLDVAQAHAGWADKLAHTLGVSLASVAPSVWHGGGHAGMHPPGPDVPGPLPTQRWRAPRRRRSRWPSRKRAPGPAPM